MTVWVLTENLAWEGSEVRGVYSTERKAREEAAKHPLSGSWFWAIVPVPVDAPQEYREHRRVIDEEAANG